MIQYSDVLVNQKAIDWWPYLRVVVGRINKAAEVQDQEELDNVFLETACLIKQQRKVTSVNELKRDLYGKLRWYRKSVIGITNMKRRLRNPVSKRGGKPLSESTLSQYRSEIKHWPKQREELKKEIRQAAGDVKMFHKQKGKIIGRGDVRLKVFYGGEHPARLAVDTQDGWRQLR